MPVMQWKDLDLNRGLWFVAGETLKNGSPLVVVLTTQAMVKAITMYATLQSSWQSPA